MKKLHLLELENRITPVVSASLNGSTLNISENAANDSAIVGTNGSNIEVRDGANNLILSVAQSSVTDLNASVTPAANQSLVFKNALNFTGSVVTSQLTTISVDAALSAANVTLSAANLNFTAPINVGSGIITLEQQYGASQAENIVIGGTAQTGSLNLDASQLATFTAGILRIGRTDNTGNITINSLTLPAGVPILSLRTGGNVTLPVVSGQISTLVVPNLAIAAGGSVSLDGPNAGKLDVENQLAINATGSVYVDNPDETSGQNLTIGTVDGVAGIHTSGAVYLRAVNQVIFQNPITTTSTVQLETAQFIGQPGQTAIFASGLNSHANAIGTPSNPLQTQVTTFAGVLALSGTYLANVGTLTIGTVLGESGVLSIRGFGGPIEFFAPSSTTSDGNLTLVIDQPIEDNIVVHGGAKTNSVTINYNLGATLPGMAFSDAPAGSQNSLTLTDTGDTTAHTFYGSDTAAGLDNKNFTLANIQSITFNGGLGYDSFYVTPSMNQTAFFVNGGGAGNVLRVDTTGTQGSNRQYTQTSTGKTGTWTFTNAQTITFTNIGSFGDNGTHYIAVGVGIGGPGAVNVYSDDMTQKFSFYPYSQNFNGGVVVATGDVNGDGVDDIVTGVASAADPHIEVFDGVTGKMIMSFDAFDPAYRGGVTIGLADLSGQGYDDIIVGAAVGTSHVVAFDGKTGALVQSFLAYPGFNGGVTVAGGDVAGNDYDDIITGTGPGGPPHVKVFDGKSLAVLKSFYAFSTSYTGGISVAATDLNGDGKADLIIGASGSNVDTHVVTFDAVTGAQTNSIEAFTGFYGGVQVAAKDFDGNGEGELFFVPGAGGPPHLRIITILQVDSPKENLFSEYANIYTFSPSLLSGFYVG